MASISRLSEAIVEIVDGFGASYGYGLLAGSRRIVTCAHVVRDSTGLESGTRPTEALVRFPFHPGANTVRAKVVVWRGPHEERGDLAGLELDAAPAAMRPFPVAYATKSEGHEFACYGWAPGDPHEAKVWVTGTVTGHNEHGRLQLRCGPLPARRGFSGGPVLDRESGRVIGLVMSAHKSGVVAQALSGDVVHEAWPELSAEYADQCPYPGIEEFKREQATLFLGRESVVLEIRARLGLLNLLIVTGPSGIGKSSILRAGLTPALEHDDESWVRVFKPGPASLWDALGALTGNDGVWRSGGMDQRVDAALRLLGKEHAVLIIDQFEEIFQQSRADQIAFVETLHALTTVRRADGGPRVRLVLGVREDALELLRELPGMTEVAVQTITPMTPAQLRSAIEGPALAGGFVRFEAGLVERIVEDVERQNYFLPAMAALLLRLWERDARQGLLTFASYDLLRHGADPIADHLGEKWANLSPRDQELARQVLLHLVAPLERGWFIRRPASMAELDHACRPVVNRLVVGRFVVREVTDRADRIDLIHDALIEHWPYLRELVKDHADYLRWRDRTRALITGWEHSGRKRRHLPRLRESLRLWLQVRSPGWHTEISQRERNFLRIALTYRGVIAGVLSWVLALLLAGGLLGAATWNRAGVAAARKASADAAAKASGESSFRLEAWRALSAYRWADTPQARAALTDVYSRLRYGSASHSLGGNTLVENPLGENLGSKFLSEPGGHIVVESRTTGSGIQATRREMLFHDVSELAQGKRTVSRLITDPMGEACRDIFGGRFLLRQENAGPAIVWDTSTAEIVGSPQLPDICDGNLDVALSPDGQMVAIKAATGVVRRYSVRTGKPFGKQMTGTGQLEVGTGPEWPVRLGERVIDSRGSRRLPIGVIDSGPAGAPDRRLVCVPKGANAHTYQVLDLNDFTLSRIGGPVEPSPAGSCAVAAYDPGSRVLAVFGTAAGSTHDGGEPLIIVDLIDAVKRTRLGRFPVDMRVPAVAPPVPIRFTNVDGLPVFLFHAPDDGVTMFTLPAANTWERALGNAREALYAPDGRHAAVLGFDGSLQLFDRATGRRLATAEETGLPLALPFHDQRLLAFSADSRLLALLHGDPVSGAIVFDVPTLNHTFATPSLTSLGVVPDQNGAPVEVSFAGPSTLLLHYKGRLHYWSLGTGGASGTMDLSRTTVRDHTVTPMPNSSGFVVLGDDGWLSVVNLIGQTWRKVSQLDPDGTLQGIDPSGRYALVVHQGGRVKVWDLDTGSMDAAMVLPPTGEPVFVNERQATIAVLGPGLIGFAPWQTTTFQTVIDWVNGGDPAGRQVTRLRYGTAVAVSPSGDRFLVRSGVSTEPGWYELPAEPSAVASRLCSLVAPTSATERSSLSWNTEKDPCPAPTTSAGDVRSLPPPTWERPPSKDLESLTPRHVRGSTLTGLITFADFHSVDLLFVPGNASAHPDQATDANSWPFTTTPDARIELSLLVGGDSLRRSSLSQLQSALLRLRQQGKEEEISSMTYAVTFDTSGQATSIKQLS